MQNIAGKQRGRVSGMTLLELTVVILVLLVLLVILVIGSRGWLIGSDRSTNILNIRNVQQVVRAHANVYALPIGGPLGENEIIGNGRYLISVETPNSNIVYVGRYATKIPEIGDLYLDPSYTNAIAASDFAPKAGSFINW